MSLTERIADVFSDAQNASINHRSLTKRLRKIEAKYENNRSAFEERVKQCVLRCLEIAKTEKAGLNTVKFICMYCSATQNEESDENEEDREGTNITNQIMIVLLPYMNAKDKVVRYRATQIVSQLMGIVQEIEDELYQAIRHELSQRVRDKVPAIRLEAVCALGRLLENEMDEEAQAAQERERDEDDEMLDDDEEPESRGLLDKLLDVLQNDTNADVRRALLMNLPIEPKTLPYLLERARDKDASVRRSLYAKLMPNLGDFRHLSLSMREKLLRWGLRDRDERVRKAAAKMFSSLWIEQIAKTLQQVDGAAEEPPSKKKQVGFHEPNVAALLELLERIDIMNAGQDEGVGPEAMREFWALRPDYFEAVSFEDSFWTDLGAESAFLARTFYDYCAHNPDAQRKAEEDQKLPEVTRFGFHLQRELNRVLEARSKVGEEADEDALAEQEFIAEQLLHIAHTLDYTDEIGRRVMFGLFRQKLSMPDLPDEITKLTLDALRLTCTSDRAGEKEFIAVVQEAIADIHDTLNGTDDEDNSGTNRETTPADDESFVSAQSEVTTRSDVTARAGPSQLDKKLAKMSADEQEEYQYKVLLVQLKCLNMTHTMFQNITSDFSTNVSLDTMLNTLVIPAVRSMEVPIRERALECLGLACLLSPKLSKDNQNLFVYCMNKGHEQLRIQCLKILCDCALTHHTDGGLDLTPFVAAFGYSAEVQLCATTCIAKLMMCGFYKPRLDPAEVEAQQAEEPDEAVDIFESAIEKATQWGTKGWELLAKVKAALIADAQGRAREQLKRQRDGEAEVCWKSCLYDLYDLAMHDDDAFSVSIRPGA